MLAQVLATTALVFPFGAGGEALGPPIAAQPDGSIVISGLQRIDAGGHATSVDIPNPPVRGIARPDQEVVLANGAKLAIDDLQALYYYAPGGKRSELSDSANSLSPAPDGSVLFADTMANEIRRVAPDGTMTTLISSARLPSCDGSEFHGQYAVLALPDGRVLFGGDQLFLKTGATIQQLSCGHDEFGAGGSLHAARLSFTALGLLPDGGWITTGDDGLFYITPPTPGRLAVALPRATLKTARAGRVEVALTAPATVTVRVAGQRVTASLPAGTSPVAIGRLGAKIYRVEVSATDGAGRIASTSLRVVGSARLPVALGRRIIRRQLEPQAGLGACHAVTARTVACGKLRVQLLPDGRLRYRGRILDLY